MTRFLPLFFALCIIVVIPSAPGQEVGCGRWEPLLGPGGTGPDNEVRAMATFDAGDGPMLYVGGDFIHTDGQRTPRLARWDGAQWSPVPGLDGPGLELDGLVFHLTVWDDGTGPALYVVGRFTMVGGVVANNIARFDGTAWSALAGAGGEGVVGGDPFVGVGAIHPHDFGDGEALYVGGRFTTAGGVPANHLARWDGASWSALDGDALIDTSVSDMASFAGDLYASLNPAGASYSGVLRFDGRSWDRVVGPGQEFFSLEVWPLAVFDDGEGERLYAGGRFSIREGDDRIAEGFAWWDGHRWEGVGRQQIASQIGDLLPFNDGSGEALYVSGSVEMRDRSLVGVARWRGGVIERMGRAPSTFGRVLATYDDGAGEALYTAGSFLSTSVFAPVSLRFIAVWRPGPGCPADFDGDCRLDLYDWFEFQRQFRDRMPRADFDGDGEFTVFDFLAFQNAFDAGCP